MPLRGRKVLDMARQARSLHRRVFEGAADDVVRLPEGATTELIDALSRTAQHSVRQIVPFSFDRPEDDFSRRVWRQVAASDGHDIAVKRLYVIPPGGDPHGVVDHQIEADQRAGAESRRLDLGTSGATNPWALTADVPLSELWLIDGCAVVRKELSDHAPPVWIVSARQADVARADEMWKLWDVPAAARPAADGGLDLTEPLLESAQMIYAMAPMSCTRDHIDRTSCSWYHGVWQYLRLFNMVSSPSWHADFYRTQLTAALAGPGRHRVLVSGAADYSMLAFVLAAAPRINGKVDPTRLDAHVMDLCPTPLNACRWYGDRFGLTVKVHEADILDDPAFLLREVNGDRPGPDTGFDLIVADAFLTRFTGDELGRVLDHWRALLRPDGRIITTVRLHPREPRRDETARSGVPQDLLRFSLRLRERALAWRGILDIDLDALLDAGRTYTMRIASHDVGDVREIVDLAGRHGLAVVRAGDDHIEVGTVDGELQESHYARLVMRIA